MNIKKISISGEVYSEIDAIRRKLVDKASMPKDLSIRETMDIIWNMKDDGMSIDEAVTKINESNIKIAWGSHGRGTKKHRRGNINIKFL